MIKQARSNATLYAEMLAAGYTDEEFPEWWFSPARGAGTTQAEPAEITLKQAEPAEVTLKQAEQAEDGRDKQGEEAYDPTPPRTPASREGRPALPASAQPSDAIRSDPALSHAQPTSATFSYAERSLLRERGITEVTPGRWMHTMAQADGRRARIPAACRDLPASPMRSYPCCRSVQLRRSLQEGGWVCRGKQYS